MEYLTVREAAEAILRGDKLVAKDGRATSILLDHDNLGDCSYARIVPKTITIGGMEVLEPILDAPKIGAWFFMPDPCVADLFDADTWEGSGGHITLLYRGMCHLTKEAAIAHAKALIAVSGGEV